jgi:glutathione S-transferase
MTNRVLYQFPTSHFCEKARWCLDHKGLDYTLRNLLPGPHMRQARKLAGGHTVPILRDGERCVAESTAIAQYLDQAYPQRPLLSADAAMQAQVLTVVRRLDAEGAEVRRWIYGQLLDTGHFRQVMYGAYDAPARWLGYAMAPVVRVALRRVYSIRPDTIAASSQRLLAGLDQLETALDQSPDHYLIGGRFTLADLTAASLYAPLLGPDGSPWQGGTLPPALEDLRHTLAQRVAGQWLYRVYRQHRLRHQHQSQDCQ